MPEKKYIYIYIPKKLPKLIELMEKATNPIKDVGEPQYGLIHCTAVMYRINILFVE